MHYRFPKLVLRITSNLPLNQDVEIQNYNDTIDILLPFLRLSTTIRLIAK